MAWSRANSPPRARALRWRNGRGAPGRGFALDRPGVYKGPHTPPEGESVLVCKVHTNAGILDVLNPDPKRIRIQDVAHALAFLCRFNGHVRFHYSVAQHSLLVATLVAERHGPRFALTALMHDAPEAFLGDLISPLKALLPDFKRIEEGLARTMAGKFGLVFPEPPEVKAADLAILAAERDQVIAPTDRTAWRELPPAPSGLVIRPMTPEQARNDFLSEFKRLSATSSGS